MTKCRSRWLGPSLLLIAGALANGCSGDEDQRVARTDGGSADGAGTAGTLPKADAGASGTGAVAGVAGEGGVSDAASDSAIDVSWVDASDDDAASPDGPVDAGAVDAPLYCPAPDSGSPSDAGINPTVCTGLQTCNGYANVSGWDPCRPARCVTMTCAALGAGYVLPDGTPCDDGNPSSFAGAPTCVTDGDCPNAGNPVCSGGDREGLACATDDDCTPNRAGPCRPTCSGDTSKTCNLDADCAGLGACSTNTRRCNAGSNRGATCATNTDCHVSAMDYSAQGISGCNKFCKGGTAPTNPVTPCLQSNSECSSLYGASSVCCPGGGLACNVSGQNKRCNGGLFSGQDCVGNQSPSTGTPSDCAHAKCVKWSCQSGACVGQHGIPRCDTQADCDLTPYNKFCALDPDYDKNAWQPTTLADPGCGTNGAPCPNTCKAGLGGDYGPAVTYTCNSATHQCLTSSAPCAGGPKGAGTVCNDVCRSGICSSDYTVCP